MAIKLTCYFIISITVFFSKCSAVIVTVDDIVSVAEGNEARIMCNIVRSSSSSEGISTVTWNNVTNGVTDTIAQSQNGVGSVRSSYIDRFSVEGDTTLVIANTSRSDNGTYQCSVTIFDDPPSPASDDIILSVIYLDKRVLISFATPVMEGNTVNMSCIANANPSPTYTFLRDGEVQQSGASSTFTVLSVSRNNNGSYMCRANNSVGTETGDIRTLDVQ
ncbi:cell surface A33 antigen-like, partial [Anneissia japonica]|uniref:cell surface A33 antigen-like n=1 Tax=Anneissia japonica TaxID=1529436 RepID=UPI0014259BFB